jgi:hypothetical protein
MYHHLSDRQFSVLRTVSDGSLDKGMNELGAINQTTLGSLFYRGLLRFDSRTGITALSASGHSLYSNFLTGAMPTRKVPGEVTERIADMLRQQMKTALRKVRPIGHTKQTKRKAA